MGYGAFQYCDSISYIDFPESVDIHEAELTFEKDKIRYQVLNGDTVLVVKNENKKTIYKIFKFIYCGDSALNIQKDVVHHIMQNIHKFCLE